MYKIRIAKANGATVMQLEPRGGTVGVLGAVMEPAPSAGERVEEVVEVQLGGSAAMVEDAVEGLCSKLMWARAAAQRPGSEAALYLEVQVTASSPALRAQILDGWVELPGGVDWREAGSQVARLHVVRGRAWEAATAAVLGSGVAANHADADHSWRVSASSAGATPGMPLTYAYKLQGLASNTPPMTLFVGALRAAAYDFNPFHRGVAGAAMPGATLTPTAEAGSVGGSCATIGWAATGSWSLFAAWRLELSAAAAVDYRGKAYRLFLRLPGGPAERTLCFVELSAPDYAGIDQTLWESDPFYLEPGSELAEGPALFLPPWEVTAGAAAGRAVRITLWLGTAMAGAKSLKLDYLALLPLDGWRTYRAVTGAPGVDIVDDGAAGVVCSSGGHVTHRVEGPGFALGETGYNYFYQLARVETQPGQGGAAAITLAGEVTISARERREQL